MFPSDMGFEELTLNFGAVLSFLLRITQRTPLKETRMKWWVRSKMVNTERMHSQNLEEHQLEDLEHN